ncbi:MAG: ABC transporter permease [Anaerolineae bacterium]|nr:ABC transporter permease [Anaerolineae bacterium]
MAVTQTSARSRGDQADGTLSLSATTYRGEPNWKRSLRLLRRHRMAMVGAGLLVFIFLYVLIGSIFIPESVANFNDPTRKLMPPSAEHIFGTDRIGRDIFARTIWGGQISLFVGVTAVTVEIAIGAAIGLAAGYLGGMVDAVLMRIAEAILSIPQLFLALIAVRVLADKMPDFQIGGRFFSSTLIVLIFVIGLTSWMRVSRIVRSVVLATRENEYVTAARSIGASGWRIVFRHVLPNCFAPIIVAATLGVATAILLEAYLGFLGLGVRPPTATWGNILGEAYHHLTEWYYWFFPAIFIILTVLGINFLGDGLRDALDPRSLR